MLSTTGMLTCVKAAPSQAGMEKETTARVSNITFPLRSVPFIMGYGNGKLMSKTLHIWKIWWTVCSLFPVSFLLLFTNSSGISMCLIFMPNWSCGGSKLKSPVHFANMSLEAFLLLNIKEQWKDSRQQKLLGNSSVTETNCTTMKPKGKKVSPSLNSCDTCPSKHSDNCQLLAVHIDFRYQGAYLIPKSLFCPSITAVRKYS